MRPAPQRAIVGAAVALLAAGCGAHQSDSTSPSGSPGAGQATSESTNVGTGSGSVTSGDGQTQTPTATSGTPGASVAPRLVPGGTGVNGVLTTGPTCPVQRAGQNCTAPLQATVEARQGNTVSASTTSDSSGRYAMALAPGSYQLVVVVNGPYPRCPTESVTVQQGQTVTADISCDSGIR